MWKKIEQAVKDVEAGKYTKVIIEEHNVIVYKCQNVIRIDLKKKV